MIASTVSHERGALREASQVTLTHVEGSLHPNCCFIRISERSNCSVTPATAKCCVRLRFAILRISSEVVRALGISRSPASCLVWSLSLQNPSETPAATRLSSTMADELSQGGVCQASGVRPGLDSPA
jgi:hypothetical protein